MNGPATAMDSPPADSLTEGLKTTELLLFFSNYIEEEDIAFILCYTS